MDKKQELHNLMRLLEMFPPGAQARKGEESASSLMTIAQENELYYSLTLQDAIAGLCIEEILEVEA